MTFNNLIEQLKGTADPLSTAVSLIHNSVDKQEGMQTLGLAVRLYGNQLSQTSLKLIKRCMPAWSLDKQEARDCLHYFETQTNPAAKWVSALLHDLIGNPQHAANLIGEIGYTDEPESNASLMLERAYFLHKANSPRQAVESLRECARATEKYQTLTRCENLVTRIAKSGFEIPSKRTVKIALLGNVTTDFYVPTLRMACFASHIEATVFAGAFGQYRQEILSPDSALRTFGPDVVILVLDQREYGLPDECEDGGRFIDERVNEITGLWKICREQIGACVIQQNFEIPPWEPYGHLSGQLEQGRARVLRRLNETLLDLSQKESSVWVLDVDHIAGLYGKGRWFDPVLWHVAKQHPSMDAGVFLARHHVAVIRALSGLTSKAIVLDLDGTCWGGVIGEDGLEGIRIGGTGEGEAYRSFQSYVVSLKKRGVILAVCSKNNEADAKLPFENHPEMILKVDDFAVFVANWKPKDENLRLIGKVLNLGLDALVFLDDNPTERAWIRSQLPEVAVPELPQDPALFIKHISEMLYFESLTLTSEDRERADSYRAITERSILEASAPTLESFLKDLDMHILLQPFHDTDMIRIVQLVNKTNQFNLTTKRRSEAQLQALLERDDCYTLSMRVRDRFGDNGLTGVLIALQDQDKLLIDTWLMSCRVLGKRIEETMILAAISEAKRRKCDHIAAKYLPTPKNILVKDLYDRLGFTLVEESNDGIRQYIYNIGLDSIQLPDYFKVEGLPSLLI